METHIMIITINTKMEVVKNYFFYLHLKKKLLLYMKLLNNITAKYKGNHKGKNITER